MRFLGKKQKVTLKITKAKETHVFYFPAKPTCMCADKLQLQKTIKFTSKV